MGDINWSFSDMGNNELMLTSCGVTTSPKIRIPATFGGKKVTKIGDDVFALSSPRIISIPKTIKFISCSAFETCNELQEIIVDEDNKCYSSYCGVLYSKDKTVLEYYPEGKPPCHFVLVDTVKSINQYAFKNSQLNSLVTNNCLNIGPYAFYKAKIDTIKISKPTKVLSAKAFWHCNFKKVVFACESVASASPFQECEIDEQVFKGESYCYPDCDLINEHLSKL